MSKCATALVTQLVKTIEDLFHHPDFNTVAGDLISTAETMVAVTPTVAAGFAAGPVALLSDVVNAAYALAHTNIVNRAIGETEER